jgi:hypothetical protein
MPNDKFNKLVNKYTSQGWNSLSDTEKADYRSYYSNLVKPVGNNTYDAVNMMQPAEVTAKRNNALYFNGPDYSYDFNKNQNTTKDNLNSQRFLMDWYRSPIAKKMLQDSYTKEGFALSSPNDMIDAMKVYKEAKRKADDNVDARIGNMLKINNDVVRYKGENEPDALAYMIPSHEHFAENKTQYKGSRKTLEEDFRKAAKLAKNATEIPFDLGNYLAYENPYVPNFVKENVGKPLLNLYDSPLYNENIKGWENKSLSDYVEKITPSRLKGYQNVKNDNFDEYFANSYASIPSSPNEMKSKIEESTKPSYNVYLKEGGYDPTTILHEVGHISTDGTRLLPSQDIKTIQEEISPDHVIYDQNNPEITFKKIRDKSNDKNVDRDYYISKPYKYFNDPTEVQTRLNVTRQQALQHGIYDPFKKLPTMQDVEKLQKLEDSNVQELFHFYSKDHILKMLRTVAQNDKKPTNKLNDYA